MGVFDPITTQGAEITTLFWWALYPSFLVFFLVTGGLLWIVWRFRQRPGQDGEPEQVTGNKTYEIAWTVAPAALLAVLFVFVLTTMSRVDAEEPAPLRVRATGWQFWFEYRFDDQTITANELHLPVGRPVMLELTGGDVIHSFWVIRFGWKRDMIPGKVNYLPVRIERPGVYDGVCSEYCGQQHAWMRIRLVAEPPEAFEAWLARQRAPADPPADDRARRGQQVFLANTCVNCHAIRGTPARAYVGPDLTHFGGRAILGAGVAENTPENLALWLRDPHQLKPGVLMPAYPNLSDEDLAALVAYLHGLK